MKNRSKILSILLVLITTTVLFPKQTSAQPSYVSFQVFYDELSPYGEWVDYPNYGYVWLPDAGPGFVPYSTEGRWIMTDYGWTWVSNYEWGWAPFHYGRWDYDNYYGWFWVPDNEWGPSWVTWRRADGYYGWQPMSPGISINLSFGRDYNRHNDRWIFVRDRDFERSNINRYHVHRNDYDRIIVNSTVINNTYIDRSRNTTYVSGPNREEVQRVTGRRVRSVAIQENNKPGQEMNNGRLRIYRPEVRNSNDREHKPSPARVTNLKEVRRPSERNVTVQPRNANPADNSNRERQQNTVTPRNNNKIGTQPTQPRNVNPPDNTRRERQQKTVTPQNNSKQVQPTRQRNTIPVDNTRQKQEQKTVTPQNNNRQVQPTRQQNVKPAENSRRVQQPNRETPKNNSKQVQQPARQRSVAPANNSQQRSQKVVTPQNDNSSKQVKESKTEEKKSRRR